MATRRMTLAAREARLAYWMLAPTFAVILAIVLSRCCSTSGSASSPSPWPTCARPCRSPTSACCETPRRRRRSAGPAAHDAQRQPARHARRRPLDQERCPPGLTLATDGPRCTQTAAVVRCSFGDWAAAATARPWSSPSSPTPRTSRPARPDVREAPTDMRARAENVLTNLVFTLDNYRRVLTGSDFWPSLWITLGYTFFSAVGSIALGLFAAMLLNGEFTRAAGCCAACSSSPTSPPSSRSRSCGPSSSTRSAAP